LIALANTMSSSSGLRAGMGHLLLDMGNETPSPDRRQPRGAGLPVAAAPR
jgi:hypothetical protein